MNHEPEWAEPFMLMIETAVAAAGLRPSQASAYRLMSQGITAATEHEASQGKSFKFTGDLPIGILRINLKWCHDGPLMEE